MPNGTPDAIKVEIVGGGGGSGNGSIADGTDPNIKAKVATAAPGASDPGVVTRTVGTVNVAGSDDTGAIVRALLLDSLRNLTVSLGTRLDAANDSIITATPALPGVLKSLEATLSASAGTVTQIAIPDDAIGVRLYARTNAIRYAVNEDPEAVGTGGPATIAVTAFKKGGFVKGNAEVRMSLPGGLSGRTLRLASTVASTVVDVEVF